VLEILDKYLIQPVNLRKGRLNTVDLLVQSILNQLLLVIIIIYLLQNKLSWCYI